MGASSGGPAPAEIFRNKRNTAHTQADAFAANAGNIFHRFQKRRPKPRDVETGSGKSKTRKSQNPNLESLEDFRDLVVSNKDYMFTYISVIFSDKLRIVECEWSRRRHEGMLYYFLFYLGLGWRACK
jgi:hypothetical protein